MPQINTIKDLANDEYSIAEIARKLDYDEKTVRKYLNQQDFSPKQPETKVLPSKLDPYTNIIDEWLEADKHQWFKQRHTAQRIHDRLIAEADGYDCSYCTVQRYVKKRRCEHKNQRANQELVWHPGEAQADFGEADFIEHGEQRRKKYLTVSFPYSNNSFTQVFGGETAECVCQGLQDIFEYIGGVPRVVIFDNATGVGRRVGDNIHETQLFHRMRAHYGFSVRFCNPYSGHEKGNVETKVGYTRRNLFVPVPQYEDVVAYNQSLLEEHVIKAQQDHYKKSVPINQLFQDDKKALRPLPQMPFDVCRYEYLKTDGYGKIRIDNRHHYSTAPEFAGQEVLVAIRAHTVHIFDKKKQELVYHSRQFGTQRSDTCDYRTSLKILMRNAGAWKNSGVREVVPDQLRTLMDAQPVDELKATLKTLQLLTTSYTFETAIAALEEGIRINRTNFSDAAFLAARLSEYEFESESESGPDLNLYDAFLLQEATI